MLSLPIRRRRSGTPLSPGKARAVAVVLIVAGIATSCGAVWSLSRAVASASWPTVDGRIAYSQIRKSTQKGKTRHRVDVTYEYAVEGRSFTGSRISFNAISTGRPGAEALARRYAVGTVVPVHYNPADPAECALEVGASTGDWWLPIFGLPFVLVGAFVGFRSLVRGTGRVR